MSAIANINFKGGESIGSVGHKNQPPVECPTCGGQVAFKGDSVEISGKKKGSGSKFFLGTLLTAIAAFGALVVVGKKDAIKNLSDGRFKKILTDLNIEQSAKKCQKWYDSAVAKIREVWSNFAGKFGKGDAPKGA